MKQNYRLTLFAILLTFTLILATFYSVTNYYKLKEQLIYNNQLQVEQASEMVQYALKSLDEEYYVLDYDTVDIAENNMSILQKRYSNNPDLETWDFDRIAKELGMDVYAIDAENVITHTNVDADLGMDFEECCTSFVPVLDERRVSGELFIDGLDVEQSTGSIKRYIYQATPDKKYLLELGFNVRNEDILDKYDFFTVIDDLMNDISPIEDIKVINSGGYIFGADGVTIQGERRDAFIEARQTNETVEIKFDRDDEEVMVRYVPLLLNHDATATRSNILEITYNKQELTQLLKHHQRSLRIQYLFVVIITTLLSTILSSWLARPMYLAFHDSLTGLKNRASFDEDLEILLVEEKQSTILLILDVDNFKMINDKLGHQTGDDMLKLTGRLIDRIVSRENYTCYRLGGDEFVVILPNENRDTAMRISHEIIEEFAEMVDRKEEIKEFSVAISVGFALSTKDDTPAELLKKADIALYRSKENEEEKVQQYRNQE